MNSEIVVADPAGNITVFVLGPAENREERAAIAKALLADTSLGAEQAGFVIPPKPSAGGEAETGNAGGPAGSGGLWRLEMMGGEFCGNAARSFGLFVARETGLRGKRRVTIGISGAAAPLSVWVDTEAGSAAAEMPLPIAEETLEYKGRSLPVYVFEGITHVIAEGFEADGSIVRDLLRLYTEKTGRGWLVSPTTGSAMALGHEGPAAFGVMFYDAACCFMKPAVYVSAVGSLVFESSCGSGSAALGVRLARDARDAEETFAINQPGGVIEATVVKREGKIRQITIGGRVSLGGRRFLKTAIPGSNKKSVF
ncbi:MAG: hypothetical protein LBS57_10270 [Treponema sp.]|jgi:diaminopimelate epimerase|nr:hypothetical protein [Treponema sp.]